MLPVASGFTELAAPILVWALAAVELIVKTTTSGSTEIQRPPNFPVFVMALVPKKPPDIKAGSWAKKVIADTSILKSEFS